jgi:hypothetical protein
VPVRWTPSDTRGDGSGITNSGISGVFVGVGANGRRRRDTCELDLHRSYIHDSVIDKTTELEISQDERVRKRVHWAVRATGFFVGQLLDDD